jgi:hypothetical protein
LNSNAYGNGLSYHAGIQVRDNDDDMAGKFVINGNGSGWLLKASYSSNIIDFNCEKLKLATDLYTGRDISTGLVVFKKSLTTDASYIIDTVPIDVSNIFFKDNTLSTSSLQKIISNVDVSGTLKISNTTESTSLSSGSFQVNGGASVNANVFVGNNLYVHGGNSIINRLGLGLGSSATTVGQTYALEISGNMSQILGGYIVQW